MAHRAYAGFAVFGAFWGAWGASLPAIRDQAGLTDGELGTALLFVGVGALPAMLTAGRAVDRWGHRVTALLLALLGGAGVAVALTATGLTSLAVGLAALGAVSGATDVAINAGAGSAERAAGRPIITRAHAAFSAAVVAASLGTGVLTAVGAPTVTPFLLVAVGAMGAAAAVAGAGPAARRPRERHGAVRSRLPLLLVAGGLGALAFAVENAHQSWSAVYLADTLRASPALAAAGPAVFAGVVAVTRFAAGALRGGHARILLAGGAGTAAAGTAALALATSAPVALAGLALAAAGTAVLFPTLLGVVAAEVADADRGTATSVVTTAAYLGFLAGPAYVGRWSDAVGLPGAMLAVAALAALLAALAWPALPGTATRRSPRPDTRTGAAA